MNSSTRRVAVLGGNRIPFARSNTAYAEASNQDMLTAAIDGLVARFGLEGQRVGSVVASIIQSDPITSGIKFPHIIKVLEDGTFAKPLVFAGVDEGATVPEEYIEGLRKVGIPWFPSTERAYRAIARLADLANELLGCRLLTDLIRQAVVALPPVRGRGDDEIDR